MTQRAPRHEIVDFRDPDRRRQPFINSQLPSPHGPSGWDTAKKSLGFLFRVTFVGLTFYHLLIIGGWLSDWYAKRRVERYYNQHHKRSHVRQWRLEQATVDTEPTFV